MLFLGVAVNSNIWELNLNKGTETEIVVELQVHSSIANDKYYNIVRLLFTLENYEDDGDIILFRILSSTCNMTLQQELESNIVDKTFLICLRSDHQLELLYEFGRYVWTCGIKEGYYISRVDLGAPIGEKSEGQPAERCK